MLHVIMSDRVYCMLSSKAWWCGLISRIFFAGSSATIVHAGTDLVTTAPAAIMDPWPISTPSNIALCAPT